MILLWGVPGDDPLDAVKLELENKGAQVRLINQRYSADMEINLEVISDGSVTGCLTDFEGVIDLCQVNSAYIRPYETSKACGVNHFENPIFLQALKVDMSLASWADLSHTAVVNRPSVMAPNNSKPYQLSLISKYGFLVPDTIITTDEIAIRRFFGQYSNIIYKSVSGIRSIVSRLNEINNDSLKDVANCPTQFQEYIPGCDVRVHVVGNKVLSAEIVTTAEDYRYASRSNQSITMKPYELPRNIAEKSVKMVQGMKLYFAGIDFRRTPDGKWYCLEVNPSPGFTFFEMSTGQTIAAEVADMLLTLDHV